MLHTQRPDVQDIATCATPVPNPFQLKQKTSAADGEAEECRCNKTSAADGEAEGCRCKADGADKTAAT